MIATPIEDYVWCDACGQPHQADFSGPEPTLDWSAPDDCEAIEPLETNVPMPKDWERDFVLRYSDYGSQYDVYARNPKLMTCHRPMYYLEESE